MNGITTIAALPSGAGRAASLPPEVGEARKPDPTVFYCPDRQAWGAWSFRVDFTAPAEWSFDPYPYDESN